MLAATAGGLLGVLVTSCPAGGRAGATVGIARAAGLGRRRHDGHRRAAWIGRDLSQLVAQPVVFGLAYLAFALAVAIRFGAIPFHIWAARLTDAVPEAALPLVTALGARRLRGRRPRLDRRLGRAAGSSIWRGPRTSSSRIAIASIVLAPVAAWIQDDLEHVVGYSIVGDAGVVILALAALDPAAWAPARIWILAFVVARSAFAAWAAATAGDVLAPAGSATCAAGPSARRSSRSPSGSSWSPASAARGSPPSTPGRRWSTWRSTGPFGASCCWATLAPARSTTGGCSSSASAGPSRVVGAVAVAPRRRRRVDVDRRPWLGAHLGGQPGARSRGAARRCWRSARRGRGRGLRRSGGGGRAAAGCRGAVRIVRAGAEPGRIVRAPVARTGRRRHPGGFAARPSRARD